MRWVFSAGCFLALAACEPTLPPLELSGLEENDLLLVANEGAALLVSVEGAAKGPRYRLHDRTDEPVVANARLDSIPLAFAARLVLIRLRPGDLETCQTGPACLLRPDRYDRLRVSLGAEGAANCGAGLPIALAPGQRCPLPPELEHAYYQREGDRLRLSETPGPVEVRLSLASAVTAE